MDQNIGVYYLEAESCPWIQRNDNVQNQVRDKERLLLIGFPHSIATAHWDRFLHRGLQTSRIN